MSRAGAQPRGGPGPSGHEQAPGGTGANGLNVRRESGYEVLTKTSGLSHDSVTAIYEDREVIVDGNLVTSRQPSDLAVFMRETMKLLRGM